MFARTSQSILSVILLFVVFAVATPAPAPVAAPWGGTPTSTITVTATATPTGGAGNCNTGPIQCCNQVQAANSGGLGGVLLGLLGIVVSPLNALVGLDCSPITVIGVGQGGCSATPVCCQNNNVGGLISIGCVPVIL